MSEGFPLEGTTILVVDDDADMRELIRAYLETTGATVVQAGDGRDALAEVARQRPHMIFCDLGLPRLGGISLVEQLGQDPSLCRIPVVAIAGRGSPSDIHEALAAGFSGHMLKPVTRTAILSEAQRVLAALSDA
jgi:CheY-like chemotaxis protein